MVLYKRNALYYYNIELLLVTYRNKINNKTSKHTHTRKDNRSEYLLGVWMPCRGLPPPAQTNWERSSRPHRRSACHLGPWGFCSGRRDLLGWRTTCGHPQNECCLESETRHPPDRQAAFPFLLGRCLHDTSYSTYVHKDRQTNKKKNKKKKHHYFTSDRSQLSTNDAI